MTLDWSAALSDQPIPQSIAGMPVAELMPEEPATETAPVPVDPYDLTPIRAQLAPYEAELLNMLKGAEALEVKDEETAAKATALGVRFAAIEKAVEAARVFFKKPALDFGRSVDALAKAYTDKAGKGKNNLARKLGTWQAQEKAKELARLKQEQEAARALQAKIDAEAKAMGTDTTPIIMPKAAAPTSIVRTEEGKATLNTRWVCVVDDLALVPREYCEVSQPLLNAAVRKGIRNIPGCTIKEEPAARFGV